MRKIILVSRHYGVAGKWREEHLRVGDSELSWARVHIVVTMEDARHCGAMEFDHSDVLLFLDDPEPEIVEAIRARIRPKDYRWGPPLEVHVPSVTLDLSDYLNLVGRATG